MQKFTSFWFGFSATWAKTDSDSDSVPVFLCFCFYSNNPHGWAPRKLLPFLGFALFVCHMSLSLSLSVVLSVSFAVYCSGLRITKGNFYWAKSFNIQIFLLFLALVLAARTARFLGDNKLALAEAPTHTHTLNNRVKAKTLIRPVICLQLAESLSSNYLCMQRKRQRKLRMPAM